MRSVRKKRYYSDFKILNQGGLGDLIDNAIKSTYYINDSEYDYLCEKMSDSELDLFIKTELTISEAKTVLSSIDRLLELLNQRD